MDRPYGKVRRVIVNVEGDDWDAAERKAYKEARNAGWDGRDGAPSLWSRLLNRLFRQ